jgi:hypothetical protein
MNAICRRVARTAFVFALLSLTSLTARAQTYAFGTASYAAPGLSSISPPQGNALIVKTDFNGDGIPDVAVLGTLSSGSALSIFLGKPDGSFGPRVDYSVQASGFAVGDFNGDGKIDVIFVCSISCSTDAGILLGNGDGTLQPPASLNQNIGGGYSAAASADFNGDGKLDLLLLTPDFGSGATAAVLLGNGDGTFQTPVTYTVPIAPYFVLGDFNGDGKPDIAVAGGLSGGVISILINNGDGTFKGPANYSISGNVQALAGADLNADGKLDLVVSSGGTSAVVFVLLGNGDGTFGSPIAYTSNLLSTYATSIAVADFNADGKLDLALTNSDGPTNAVAIVFGNGDGTFQNPPLLYSAGLLPAALVSLDVNGDGKPDLAVAGGYGVLSYFSLTTLINRGDGTFPSPTTYPVLQFPYSAVVGDFNGDGHVDIATTSFTQTGGVSVLLGKGDGTFQAHVDSPTGQFPSAIAVADFNGDGKIDLVVGDSTLTSQLLSTLIGNADGTFQNNISQTLTGILRSVAVGDFNGDGKLDVAAVIDGTNAVSIFLGHGDGSFAAPVQYPTGPMILSPPYHNVLAGDFNGDGKPDLAVATDNGVAILLGNGNGTFQPFSVVPSLVSSEPGDELLALTDFNNDGKLDIVKATQTGASIINVALGNGDGTFQQALGFQIPSILNTEPAVVGDFNGDGKPDLAFASQSSNVVTILFGNGDGTFQGHIEYSVPSVSNNVNSMVAADFNGDGTLDMALADFGNSGAGEVSVFVNQPVAAFAPRALKFANQGIDTTSPQQSVTLTNGGAAPLDITSIAASGDFAETNDCGSSLSVGRVCNVTVAFAPTADGARGGMLSFSDNSSVVPQAIVLSGTGTGAGFLIGVAPGSSASQTVSAGQMASYSLVFTSAGGFNGAITLACSGAPVGLTCTPSPASFPLPGASAVTATINVATTAAAFAPLAPSMPARSVSLRLHFDLGRAGLLLATLLLFALLVIFAGRSRRPKWLALTSTAVLVLIWAGCGGGGGVSIGPPPAPSAIISPSNLTFSSQNQGSASPVQTVKLTNSGNAALSVTAISTGGTNAGDFQQTNTCGSSVMAGGNCSISVTFTPTAAGSRSATLSIGDNAAGSPQLVNLAGTGVPPATSAGTYTMTVTATSGALTQTMRLVLTVQ